MKKKFCIVLAGVLAAVCWNPVEAQAVDSRAVREELEIMEGILSKTASFSLQGTEVERGPSFGPSVDSIYLYGQGAVFFLDAGLGASPWNEQAMLAAQEMLEASEVQVEAGAGLRGAERALRSAERTLRRIRTRERRVLTFSNRPAVEAYLVELPEAPTAPPVPPVPGASSGAGKGQAASKEAVKKKMAKLKAELASEKKKLKALRAANERRFQVVRRALVEALARHGDALTQVKSNEYVTLVFDRGSRHWPRSGLSSGIRHTMLSVPKSAIVDYNAGRLTMEDFRKKIVEYRN